jgi:cholesterol transport system auxiliary component
MRRKVAAILIVLILGAGCLPIPKESLEKKEFVLDVSRPPGEKANPSNGVLRVNEFRVAEQYEGRGFKYRLDDVTFQSDFYNEFFILPGQMIAEETRQWLDQSGIFKDVVGESGQLQPSYILDGLILELYGDYSSSVPKGIMAIEFVLVREVRGQSDVIFKNSYRQEQPASGKSAKELARAWNKALFSTLEALEKDMQGKISG